MKSQLFTTKTVRIIGLSLMDSLFMLLSWAASFFFYSYLFKDPTDLIITLITFWYILILVNTLSFVIFGVYRNIWLYASTVDLLRIAVAAAVSNFTIYCLYRLHAGHWSSPSTGILAFLIHCILCGGIRFFPRIRRELTPYFSKTKQSGVRVLIIGAGHSASMLIRELKPRSKYVIVGLVDDDVTKLHMAIMGVKVIGTCEDIRKLVSQLGIQEILIAIPSATARQLNRIVSLCPTNQCKLKLINGINSQTPGNLGLSNLDYSSMLLREETKLDISGVENMVKNKVVLVTGGSGSIGSELTRQLMKFDIDKVIVYDMYENTTYNLQQELLSLYPEKADTLVIRIGNILDTKRLEQIFLEFHPAVVFHAAAYKHVPLMEYAPELAIETNVFGTMNTARLSIKYNVERFVMISSDKAVNPTNIMGASKRLAERCVISLNSLEKTEFVCVRFGNVLGSNGSVLAIFQNQINNGGPITVTHPEITRYFMTIPEAARLVIQAACMANGPEIFVLDMGEPIKIVELAETMIRLSGLIPYVDINIEFSGLRPGEKLFEELLIDMNDIMKTDNEKIFVATQPVEETEYIEWMIAQLKQAINDDSVVDCVKMLEPTFIPYT